MTLQSNQTSIEFTRAGIKKAEDSANRLHTNWSEKAYEYLKRYVASRKPGERFLAEDIRQDAETCVPTPPSYRAWGSVLRRAIMEQVVRKVGFANVSNVRAHKAVATVYVKGQYAG